MTDADWLAQIEDDPDDVATKLAYADWLRDRDKDALANAWEWMARRGRWPHVCENGYYTWRDTEWWKAHNMLRFVKEQTAIDAEVVRRMCGLPRERYRMKAPNHRWIDFVRLQDAVSALAVALAKLSTPGAAGTGPASRPGRTATTAPPGGGPGGA